MSPTSTKEEGMAAAWSGTTDEWKAAALEAVRRVASAQDWLTVDDVSAHVPDPREGRAWGPLMRTACADSIIEQTANRVQSGRESCHRAERAVYKSLIREVTTPIPGKVAHLSLASILEKAGDPKSWVLCPRETADQLGMGSLASEIGHFGLVLLRLKEKA